jgi:hypothetical protein
LQTAVASIPDVIAETPAIVNVEVVGDGWSRMSEFTPGLKET